MSALLREADSLRIKRRGSDPVGKKCSQPQSPLPSPYSPAEMEPTALSRLLPPTLAVEVHACHFSVNYIPQTPRRSSHPGPPTPLRESGHWKVVLLGQKGNSCPQAHSGLIGCGTILQFLAL